MKKSIVIFLISAKIIAQTFSDGFNFNLPWNDSTTQNYLPKFPIVKIEDGKFITTDNNGNFIHNGKPIRFWGSNCVASGAFPQKNIAGLIAGRMRKFGINLIRLHHIDNDWGGPSLLTGVDTRSLNPTYLDLLENFIARMKENGIFINMNLNVSRMFKAFDGVTYADSVKNFGTDFFKVVTLFDPYLIQLQKEYAQQLLTHVNPYTGKALVDDPVMAMVETNNENSLYRAWRDNILKPIKSGGKLIYYHVKMLDSLWNNFLLKKYQTNENLRSSWNKNIIASGENEQIKNGGFEQSNLRKDWALEQHNGASADTSRDNTTSFKGNFSVKIVVTNGTGTEWHIQFKQPTLSLKKDSSYTVTFAAKSEASHQINVSVMNDVSPWNGYGGKNFTITNQWNVYTFSFKANENNNGHARITFQLGKEKATYWIDEVSVTKASVKGLLDDENLALKNVRRIDYADCVGYSDERVKDMSEFYITLQQNYFKDFFSYLKNTLKVKVPIVGTNWNVGAADLASMNVGDYIDNHSYWDHPQFPNSPWSSTDWLINNKPMVKDANGGTIPALFAAVQMVGKPYTISEYNHAFPNQYQSEAVNFLLGYSSFHGANGIMFFDYNGSSNWTDDKIDSYFSINRNPIFMAQYPIASYVFRNFLIPESTSPKIVNYKAETINLIPKNDSNDWSGTVLFNRKNALINSIKVGSYNSNSDSGLNELQNAPSTVFVTDNEAITWDTNLGVLAIKGNKYESVTGYFNNLANKKVGSIYFYPTEKEYFGSLSILEIDAKRSIISLVSKAQNTGMIWNGTTTINNNWGSKPTQVYPLKIKLDLTIYADSIRLYPLDQYGKENESNAKTIKPFAINHFMIELDQNVYRTLWFGIKKFGQAVLPSTEDFETLPDKFELFQNYPNPFNPTTTIRFTIPSVILRRAQDDNRQSRQSLDHHDNVTQSQTEQQANPSKGDNLVTLKIYDIIGREVATLVNEYQKPGVYNYQFSINNYKLSSGVYFYKLQAGGYVAVKKMMILK